VPVLKRPWPSIARMVRRDRDRYLDKYMRPLVAFILATEQRETNMGIFGIDDMVNISGHRLSTSEIERALVMHRGVAETTAIRMPDDLTDQPLVSAFVT
jgi:acetyl-CoA synthetase